MQVHNCGLKVVRQMDQANQGSQSISMQGTMSQQKLSQNTSTAVACQQHLYLTQRAGAVEIELVSSAVVDRSLKSCKPMIAC